MCRNKISYPIFSFRPALAVCVVWAMLGGAACHHDKAQLSISPESMDLCSGKDVHSAVALDVSWDVRPLGLERARLEVNNFPEPAKLWALEGAVGSAKTGGWAHEGFTVTLRAMNGVELARRTYVIKECDKR